MDLEALRMFERIIIAFGGILSVFLGYRLFFLAGAASDSGGRFKTSLITMSMTKVGPGVFFALFGAYVLVTGLTASIKTEIGLTSAPTAIAAAAGRDGVEDLVFRPSGVPFMNAAACRSMRCDAAW
jgi:hypothetical protein